MSAAGPGPGQRRTCRPAFRSRTRTKIAQGDMSAIAALVARFKANKILPLQPEFIAFFAALPEDAWLALRQAMIDAKVPIRDIDKKVKANARRTRRPPFVPSDIDDANSYGLFTMTKDGLFKALKQAQIRICVAFRSRWPHAPRARSWRAQGGSDGLEHLTQFPRRRRARDNCARRILRAASQAERGLRHAGDVGMSITPGRVEQQAFAEYLIGHPSKKRAWRLAQRGWAKVDGQMIYATRRKIFSAEPLKGLVLLADKVDAALRPHGELEGWQNGLARLAEPHRLARLAISTALAGSLLDLGGFEGGGIHFGGASGTGKTTISMFALSVDGDPSNPGPCVMTWDGTFVGFEISLFDRNDACAVIDEAGKASDFQIGEKIYLLSGGKGRERGTKEITLRETLMWRVSIVSTAEFLLENKMAEIEATGKKRARGGQVSRILDIEARGVEAVESVLGRLVEKRRQRSLRWQKHRQRSSCRRHQGAGERQLWRSAARFRSSTSR